VAEVVRIGILGAAAIAPAAMCKPATDHPRTRVVAVAARDRTRAERFATRWSIPTVHDGYDALLGDPDVDAVYIPLPNGLHGRWTAAAVDAGKHVLCEKPFCANAAEARAVADRVAETDRVVMEAFHWRYHPAAARVLELIEDGAIGELTAAHASFCFPLTARGDIRWDLPLAGGALKDAGCYPIHMLRTFVGTEPQVTGARAWLRAPGVDRRIDAALSFPPPAGGSTVAGTVRASMWSSRVLDLRVRVEGTDGSIGVLNPLAPQYWSRISVTSRGRRFHEQPPRSATYRHQLDAFVAAILDGAPVATGPADAVANMEAIDAVYRAAGLAPRTPTGAPDEGPPARR
jgi:predicted dehydrogenase